MENPKIPKLNPCSVCGKDVAEMRTAKHLLKASEYYVHCANCHCETALYASLEDAAAAWNDGSDSK